MSVFLLANVGNRDVLSSGEKIEPARSRGREILDRLEKNAQDLTLPLLTPAVRKLLDHHQKIEIVLFATDQPEGNPEEHREKDTLYLAEMAKALLEPPNGPKGVERVWIKIIQVNPSLYDDTLAYFRATLSPRQGWIKNAEACYAYPVGGTPAANMGLLLAALEAFGERCSTIYLPQGENYPVKMDLGDQLRRGVAGRLARDRLNDLSFGAAAPLLREAGAPEWTACVAQYCSYRYHFDFDAAAERLEHAKATCGGDERGRALCERLRQDMLGLRDGKPDWLLRELYHNGHLAYDRGEYAAFLGIVFRFQEAVLRYLVERLYTGISTDVHDDETRKKLLTQLEEHPRLLDYLKMQRVNNGPLRYDKPDRPALSAMLRCSWEVPGASDNSELVERCRAVSGLLQRFDCLSSRRNKSIIAHGFEGVSSDKILDDYERAGHRGEPLSDMAEMLQIIDIKVGESPFSSVARLLVRELEKL